MSKLAATDAYAIAVKVLVDLRKASGVGQVELAQRLGKTQQYVSYLERRERRIDVIEFYAIASALGADPVETYQMLVRQLPADVEI